MSASHRHTFDMIPWLVTGRVSDEERRELEEHMRGCADCRAELTEQERVRAAMCDEPSRVDYAAGASLQKLWTRIGTSDSGGMPERRAPVLETSRGTRHRVMQWLIAAVVAEAIGITMLAAASISKPTATAELSTRPEFSTVTSTQSVPTTPALRVVFAPEFTVTELNALLLDQHLEIVNGPSSGGVYTLATTDATTETHSNLPQALKSLRDHRSGVLFAEPIERAIKSKP